MIYSVPISPRHHKIPKFIWSRVLYPFTSLSISRTSTLCILRHSKTCCCFLPDTLKTRITWKTVALARQTTTITAINTVINTLKVLTTPQSIGISAHAHLSFLRFLTIFTHYEGLLRACNVKSI